jgi:hypothetical protein
MERSIPLTLSFVTINSPCNGMNHTPPLRTFCSFFTVQALALAAAEKRKEAEKQTPINNF